MKIAVVHSFYSASTPSGENQVVLQHVEALRDAGHDVLLLSRFTDDMSNASTYAVGAAWRVATTRGPDPLKDMGDFLPDVVHVHNTFPNFGRDWAERCPFPLVVTMHNYRTACANAIFYRDGRVCTDCLARNSSWPAVVRGCYRDSRVSSVPVAIGVRFGRDPFLQYADKVLVLSSQAREIFSLMGVPDERLASIGNFVDAPSEMGVGGNRFLFVGRFTPEKGLLEMLEGWPEQVGLDVVGSGPLETQARSIAPASVRFLGSRPRPDVLDLMSRARGLTFPSRCFEGLPTVYLESLACGTPVLAWEPSVVAGLVREQGTGLVVDDSGVTVERANEVFPNLRFRSREVFETTYSRERWIAAMTRLYEEAIAVRSSAR